MREIALALLLVACSRTEVKPETRARCVELFDKYGAFLAREGRDTEPYPEDVLRLRAALQTPEGLARCEAELTDARYRCALAATDADGFERCFEGKL